MSLVSYPLQVSTTHPVVAQTIITHSTHSAAQSILFNNPQILASIYAWVGEPHRTARISKFSAAVTRSPLYYLEIQKSFAIGVGATKYQAILERVATISLRALPVPKGYVEYIYQALLQRILELISVNTNMKLVWKEDCEQLKEISKNDYNVLNLCHLLPEVKMHLESASKLPVPQRVWISRWWLSSKLIPFCFPEEYHGSSGVMDVYRENRLKVSEIEAIIDEIAENISIYFNRQMQVSAIFSSLKTRMRELSKQYPELDKLQQCGTIMAATQYLEIEKACNDLAICSTVQQSVSKGIVSHLYSLATSFFRSSPQTFADVANRKYSDLHAAMQKMSVLQINRRGLTRLSERFCFTSLRVLDLSDNHLESLPEAIGVCTRLIKISLLNNRLKTLPESIRKLTRLTVLDLRKNQLESLPEEIGFCTRLTSVWLSTNRLKTLPESIGKLTSLKDFDLSFNRLERLPASVGSLIALRNLELNYQSSRELLLPKEIGNLKLSKLSLCLNIRDILSNIRRFKEYSEKDPENAKNLKETLDAFELTAAKTTKARVCKEDASSKSSDFSFGCFEFIPSHTSATPTLQAVDATYTATRNLLHNKLTEKNPQ